MLAMFQSMLVRKPAERPIAAQVATACQALAFGQKQPAPLKPQKAEPNYDAADFKVGS